MKALTRIAYKLILTTAAFFNLFNALNQKPAFACGGYYHCGKECMINRAESINATLIAERSEANWMKCEHALDRHFNLTPIGKAEHFEDFTVTFTISCKGLRGFEYRGDGTERDPEITRGVILLDRNTSFRKEFAISTLTPTEQDFIKRTTLESQLISYKEFKAITTLPTVHQKIEAMTKTIERINLGKAYLAKFNDAQRYQDWAKLANQTKKSSIQILSNLQKEQRLSLQKESEVAQRRSDAAINGTPIVEVEN